MWVRTETARLLPTSPYPFHFSACQCCVFQLPASLTLCWRAFSDCARDRLEVLGNSCPLGAALNQWLREGKYPQLLCSSDALSLRPKVNKNFPSRIKLQLPTTGTDFTIHPSLLSFLLLPSPFLYSTLLPVSPEITFQNKLLALKFLSQSASLGTQTKT